MTQFKKKMQVVSNSVAANFFLLFETGTKRFVTDGITKED